MSADVTEDAPPDDGAPADGAPATEDVEAGGAVCVAVLALPLRCVAGAHYEGGDEGGAWRAVQPVRGGEAVVALHEPTGSELPRDLSYFCFPPLLRRAAPSFHSFSFTEGSGERRFASSLAAVLPAHVLPAHFLTPPADEAAEAAEEVAVAVVVICDWPVFALVETFALHAQAQLRAGRAAALPAAARTFCAQLLQEVNLIEFLWRHPCWRHVPLDALLASLRWNADTLLLAVLGAPRRRGARATGRTAWARPASLHPLTSSPPTSRHRPGRRADRAQAAYALLAAAPAYARH